LPRRLALREIERLNLIHVHINGVQFKAKGLMTSDWDSEEDFRCNVCNSAATEAKNPIIFCDTCDMTTHVECYGLQNTPRGSWFCTKCKSKEQLEVVQAFSFQRGVRSVD
jgi:hypothetical protein